MITANMHEAKSRLSELVRTVEETGEIVIIQRDGKPVAELHRYVPPAADTFDRLAPHPELKVTLAPDYDPAEPLQPDELADWMK